MVCICNAARCDLKVQYDSICFGGSVVEVLQYVSRMAQNG